MTPTREQHRSTPPLPDSRVPRARAALTRAVFTGAVLTGTVLAGLAGYAQNAFSANTSTELGADGLPAAEIVIDPHTLSDEPPLRTPQQATAQEQEDEQDREQTQAPDRRAVRQRPIIGATTHLAQGTPLPMVLQRMSEMRLQSIRDEAYWSEYEKQKGRYSLEGLTPATRDALAGRIDVSDSVLVLSYGNPLYDGGHRPTSPQTIQGFVDYAVNLIKAGGHRFGYVQIWNEWNVVIGTPDRTPGRAADYARLFIAVSEAIRPLGNFKILTAGSQDSWDGWAFQKGILARGVLRHADGFGHHSYNWRDGTRATPEVLIERLEKLQNLLRSANGGRDFPIYITEMGWPTWSAAGYSDEQSGEWIADFLRLCAQRPWVKGMWLYNLFDNGHDRNDPEQGFGLFTKEGADAKPRTSRIRAAIESVK